MDRLLPAFEEYLKTRGLRLTAPRRLIVQKVLALHNHFTADDLYHQLEAEQGPISKATLYRTLALLTESDLLEAQDFGGDAKYYEHKLGHQHHDHMVCVRCHRILEFRDDAIEAAQVRVAQRERFRPLFHTLKMYGICSACSE